MQNTDIGVYTNIQICQYLYFASYVLVYLHRKKIMCLKAWIDNSQVPCWSVNQVYLRILVRRAYVQNAPNKVHL